MKYFSLLMIFFTTSCANYLRTESLAGPEKKIAAEQLEYFILVSNDIVSTPQISLSVEQLDMRRVDEFHVITDYDYATPYVASRELMEFPVGVVLLACGITVNVIDLALLGLLPNHFASGILDDSLSGMNPLLNMESDSRFERTIVKVEKKKIHSHKEVKRLPAREVTVTLRAGSLSQKLLTDSKGQLQLDFLEPSLAKFSSARTIELSVGSGANTAVKSLTLTRGLAFRMEELKQILEAYKRVKNTESLALAIYSIEKELGFVKYAVSFEKKELRTRDESFIRNYKKQLKDRYKR